MNESRSVYESRLSLLEHALHEIQNGRGDVPPSIRPHVIEMLRQAITTERQLLTPETHPRDIVSDAVLLQMLGLH